MEFIEQKAFRSDSFDIDTIKEDLMNLEKENMVSEYKTKELKGELLPEPLLLEDKSRFVLFPIKHTDVGCIDCIDNFEF